MAESVGRRGKDDGQTAPTHSSVSESRAAHHHPHVHVTTQPEKESFSSLSSDYSVSSSLTVDRSSVQSSVGVALHSLTFGASGTKNYTMGERGNGTERSLRSNPAPRGATISSGGRSLKTQVYRKHSNPITSRTPLDLTAIPPPSLDTPSPSDAPARRNPSSVEQREPSFPSTPERNEVKPQTVTPSADVGKVCVCVCEWTYSAFVYVGTVCVCVCALCVSFTCMCVPSFCCEWYYCELCVVCVIVVLTGIVELNDFWTCHTICFLSKEEDG